MKLSTLKICAIIGSVAALMGCLADLLLLYVPHGGYENWDYRFFEHISASRLTWGHYIGVFAIPLELVGLMVVFEALRPAGEKWRTFLAALVVYMMTLGVAYHAMLAPAARVKNALGASVDAAFFKNNLSLYFEPLGHLFFGLFAIVGVVFIFLILKQKTAFPKWAVLFSPLCVYVYIAIFYALFSGIGSAFMVAGFNFSILILIAGAYFFVRKEASREKNFN